MQSIIYHQLASQCKDVNTRREMGQDRQTWSTWATSWHCLGECKVKEFKANFQGSTIYYIYIYIPLEAAQSSSDFLAPGPVFFFCVPSNWRRIKRAQFAFLARTKAQQTDSSDKVLEGPEHSLLVVSQRFNKILS